MKQMYVFTIFVQSIFIVFLSLFVGCGNTNEIDEMDVTPPAEISELNTIAGDCQVVLSWIDPLDDDFEKVEVLYSPGNNMVEVPRGEQSLLVSGLINGVSYVFTLKTVDRNVIKVLVLIVILVCRVLMIRTIIHLLLRLCK